MSKKNKTADHPKAISKSAYERLEAEVRQRKSRKPTVTITRKPAATSVADVMPSVLAKIERMRKKCEAFADEIRPNFDLEEFSVPCEKHEYFIRVKDWDKTLESSWAAQDFVIEYKPCQQCSEEAEAEKMDGFWRRRGVPERLLRATLDNFDPSSADPQVEAKKRKALTKADIAAKTSNGFVIFIGSTGTGKGHLATGILKEDGNGRFITHAALIAELRSTYTSERNGPRQADFYDKYMDAPVLVLDEVGVRTQGKDEEDCLYRILAHRHDHRLLTILTTNEELPTLKSILGYRLADRIGENQVVIPCKWPSYREEHKVNYSETTP